MRYDQVTLAPPLTKVTKYLIIACTAIYFATLICAAIFRFPSDILNDYLGLVPRHAIGDLWLWQFGTYIFLHGSPFHLLFNMLVLWFFGAEIELRMGERRYLLYFLLCGVAAGLCSVGMSTLFRSGELSNTAVIGSSGAVYGLLAAYGLLFWDRYLLMFFLFPIKAQYYALVVAGLEIAMGLGQNDNVSHVAHIGGLVAGGAYVYFTYFRPRRGKGRTKRDIEKEKLKRQFTLIVNDSVGKTKDDSSGPYWN